MIAELGLAALWIAVALSLLELLFAAASLRGNSDLSFARASTGPPHDSTARAKDPSKRARRTSPTSWRFSSRRSNIGIWFSPRSTCSKSAARIVDR